MVALGCEGLHVVPPFVGVFPFEVSNIFSIKVPFESLTEPIDLVAKKVVSLGVIMG